MAIPKETNKELVVTVENESISVAISPPILDGVIVTGYAPEQNPDTMLFVSYDPVTGAIAVRTAAGQEFSVGTTDTVAQVTWGTANPVAPGAPNSIYINTTDNSIWSWSE